MDLSKSDPLFVGEVQRALANNKETEYDLGVQIILDDPANNRIVATVTPPCTVDDAVVLWVEY